MITREEDLLEQKEASASIEVIKELGGRCTYVSPLSQYYRVVPTQGASQIKSICPVAQEQIPIRYVSCIKNPKCSISLNGAGDAWPHSCRVCWTACRQNHCEFAPTSSCPRSIDALHASRARMTSEFKVLT
jgi:hypothetical protein